MAGAKSWKYRLEKARYLQKSEQSKRGAYFFRRMSIRTYSHWRRKHRPRLIGQLQ